MPPATLVLLVEGSVRAGGGVASGLRVVACGLETVAAAGGVLGDWLKVATRTSFSRSFSPTRNSEAVRTRLPSSDLGLLVGDAVDLLLSLCVELSSLLLEDLPVADVLVVRCGFFGGAFSEDVIDSAVIQSRPSALAGGSAGLVVGNGGVETSAGSEV